MMTNELIGFLYSLGKRVYANELNMHAAVDEVMKRHGTTIAKSSAEFYIIVL